MITDRARESRLSRRQRRRAAERSSRRSGTLFALVRHTLRLQGRSIIIWGLALGLLSAVTVASFPAMEEQGQAMDDLLRSYPPEMREVFGIGEGTNLSTIEGFLASQVFNFVAPLALAFFPILAASNAIAGAEERGTIDVLLGNPIPRWQIVAGSFTATALSTLGILAILGLATYGAAVALDVELPLARTAEAVLNLWPLCIFFGGLAMLCSALFHRRLLAVAIPGAVLVASYFVNALGNVVEGLEDARPFTAFYYYGSAIEDGIEWASFGGVALAAGLLAFLAALVFSRRDIYT